MGVPLAAAGVLAFEVLLTRVFSVVMWYHFASMAIAAAMLGLSAGGLSLYLFRRRVPPEAAWCALSALFAALPYGLCVFLSREPAAAGRILSLFHQPYFEPFRGGGGFSSASDAGWLALVLFFLSLPFAGAGAVFAGAFSRPGLQGRTYLEVMAGSAAGVLLYLAAMRAGSGPAAFLFVSALFALAAAAFALEAEAGTFMRRRGAPLCLACAILLGAGGAAEAATGFAEIRFVRGRYEPGLLWVRWDAASRVAVYPVSQEEARRGWGLSPAWTGPVPEQIGMVVDDTGYTALFGTGKDPRTLVAFGANVASAAARVRERGKALVIGPGGGKDILCMLASGDFAVTAVEMNPLVVRAADSEFGDFTGRPYRMRGVRAVVAEGRNFLAADRTRYDVIQMTQVFGRIPPSAGAFTMTEDHLYTTEAFLEYLGHLSDAGVLTITRFVHERRVWRILAMAREALLRLGASDPTRHVVVLRDRGLVNILVRRTPWPQGELARLRRFADEMRFAVAAAPGRPAAGIPGAILAGAATPRETAPFDFSAPTDDRPFFYYTLLPSAFLFGSSASGGEFEDRAVAMLKGFLAGAALLCLLLLVAPGAVLAKRRGAPFSFAACFYMFAAGVAYIVWEIVMIERLSILFGRPVVSFAAGLTMILALSGAGGWLCGRLGGRLSVFAALAAVAAASVHLTLAGPRLVRFAGSPFAARAAVALLFVLPPSLLMGVFFPEGLRRFGKARGGAVPFYFAANGAASVLGAAAAQALAMNVGYRAAGAAGALLYAACALLLAAAPPQREAA